METLPQILARNVALIPDQTFLIWEDERISHAEFGRRTARMANVLGAAGIGPGDRVGLYLPSTPMMAVAFWACQRLGAVPAPISAMFRQSELTAILSSSRIRALVTDAATQAYFDTIRADLPGDVPAFVTGGAAGAGDTDLDAAMKDAPDSFDDHPATPHDTAALFFTSGTTGRPKAIEQTHFNNCSSFRDMMVAHGTQYGRETYLCAVPLFTNFGLTVTLNLCAYTGGTMVLHERWDTERVLTDIARHKASYFGGTPTMYVYMVGGYDPARHDLTSLRVCTTGGSPVPQPVIRRFEELSGVKVSQVYGATETCGQNVMEPVAGLRKPGAAGLPVGSSRILIVDEDGQPMPVGEVGEVVIGGDCVTPGYADDPEATAAAFGPDGWRSGDLGYVDADGFLFIVDRKKDVIITGGHNIYPLEVESTLYQHGGVSICAVVPEPDEAKGEIPVAVVVPLEGREVSADDLMAFCRDNLAAYKVPRRIELIDDMPVEAAKIRKRDLVEALKSGGLDKYRKG
ncbi:class I adenylate-forming enzyme family protein [Maritimibacter fusiformis]|uniref:Acyl--CoA ligase n=1 Tax=Maritimibacter fusiformis TaxID=2603819 RepID=A0A5D0RNR9_9RHOB|nr:class I adenylate-forming enzyme family protein [Maritimibacter fusiformis]TYB83202.1 acyl--CoA ligase [Maritimibacter fusiformis]